MRFLGPDVEESLDRGDELLERGKLFSDALLWPIARFPRVAVW